MPRPTITTSYTPRTPPSSSYWVRTPPTTSYGTRDVISTDYNIEITISYLLQEIWDFILQENGFKIILEESFSNLADYTVRPTISTNYT